MQIESINTVDDVRMFFKYLVNDKELNFHPDTDFTDYINISTGKTIFSDEEITRYNRIMDSCFVVCNKHNVDIYDFGIQTLKGPAHA